MTWLISWFPTLFRYSSTGSVAATGWGMIIFIAMIALSLYGSVNWVKGRMQEYVDSKIADQQAQAIIESADQSRDDVKDFKNKVKEDEEKIGTDDVFDIINGK